MGVIFITGATGLVGRRVATDLIASGHKVRALLRTGRALDLNDPNFEVVRGDLSQTQTYSEVLPKVLRGVDRIVHSAALVGDSGNASDYERINIDATLQIAQLGKQAGVRQLIYLSSLGVYPGRDHHGSDESVATNLSGLDAYTRSKAIAEKRLLLLAEEIRMPTVALRPGFIYGEYDRVVVPRIIDRLRQRSLVYFGSGERKTNCIYVGNVSHAIAATMQAFERNHQSLQNVAINITDSPTATKREFVEAIADAIGAVRPTISIPRPVALTIAEFSEFAARLGIVEKPPVSRAAFKFLGLNLDYSIERAKQLIGYSPPWSWREGIAITMNWYSNLHAGAAS